ncbi:hypothetical protein AKJ45_02720 [candidate division MSBL1 archaeon SCGC-AAA261F19]|uniref:DNA-binding protein AKJ45_02720 n=2 Tax=candidate division MSBL1 TaxID=215777 RepID=A0A133V9H5_9EURY|nr:hypothetical protein AKJ43_01355 [candidate division MSBL1 archaeon SCGC-AAA261D19]KXB03047.1 hypothetical protein AKJ45_02720 [candidate division MSBL1 archaeon SCGC-AAA261F19]
MNLDEIRKRKMLKLQKQMQEQEEEKEAKKKFEAKKKLLMRKILTPEARSRLANLRLTKPKFVENIELQLVQIARSGRIDLPINDEQLREMLKQLKKRKRSINIRRK